jgi:hypothetical protein
MQCEELNIWRILGVVVFACIWTLNLESGGAGKTVVVFATGA